VIAIYENQSHTTLYYYRPFKFMLFKEFNRQDHEEIMSILNQQERDWNNHDIKGFMGGYWKSDSLIFIVAKS